MQTDAGMTRLRTCVDIRHEDDLVTEESLQERDCGRMADQLRDRAAFKLNIGSTSLVDTIGSGGGLEMCCLRFEPDNLLGGQKVGEDHITLDLNLTNAFP